MITWAIAHIEANGTLPCKLKPSQILMVSTYSRVFFEEDNFAIGNQSFVRIFSSQVGNLASMHTLFHSCSPLLDFC